MAMKTSDIKKWLAFGTGVGIEIRGDDLEVTVARVRPQGVRILGTTTIVRFRQRPASEWGAEYARFLTTTGGSHLAAAVLLPRREMVVRRLSLPGVASRDMDAAIRFQVNLLFYPEKLAVFLQVVNPFPQVPVNHLAPLFYRLPDELFILEIMASRMFQ